MKYLILVGDGMGGHPLAELHQKTTLEAAKTPAMDRLCQQGELFFTKTVPDGFLPGSDVANLFQLSMSPQKKPPSSSTHSMRPVEMKCSPFIPAYAIVTF